MKQILKQKRAAGILMPVFSLPSPYGIGSFGKAAYDWVDFLVEAGQSYWQVLPLGPTSFGDSPYQSFSAFAGNSYFIDLDLLCEKGLLKKEECAAVNWGGDKSRVDYYTIFKQREPLLRKAFSRFEERTALETFRTSRSAWIDDYALYMAIKAEMGLKSWTEWNDDVRLREQGALDIWRKKLENDIVYHIFVQYLFSLQWGNLKTYANGKGISIIGDIPIYVAMDSADVWANSGLFLLNEDRMPIEVAGVPPDGFSDTGQLWGNPLYRWDVLERDGYSWWIERLRSCFEMYDVLRIDHFRGFESYFAVPFGSKTAEDGKWRKGPGLDFISEINRRLNCESSIIAEDLGFLTAEVRELLKRSGYPGMKVLQFAFDSREESDYMPHNYERHCVVFTGTHDNDTVRGWFSNATSSDIKIAREYLGVTDGGDEVQAFIRAALGSVADLVVIPIQDYLGLGSEARINIPSTVGGNNWQWRVDAGVINSALAKKIARLVKIYSRENKRINLKENSFMDFKTGLEKAIKNLECKSLLELYNVVGKTAVEQVTPGWRSSREGKKACYLSMEFLIGRMIYSNLMNLGVMEEFKQVFEQNGLDANMFEEVEDAALGNGGLGRLAACFLDSAATHDLPLDGYGIRYKYGLFKQYFHDGFQCETADDWTKFGDPWSVRREKERVKIEFKDQSVWAVPYDMPVIGYGGKTVNTLRLWQAEAVCDFSFSVFNEQRYNDAYLERSLAEAISSVLYPNDDTDEGKKLRIKQQYFFSSASLQNILREYKAKHGSDFSKLADSYAIQLNDTHPTVAIPELLRILISVENLTFEEAYDIAFKTFAYTNHTIMAEALEKWDVGLFCSVIPDVYPYVIMLQNKLKQDLHNRGINGAEQIPYYIVDENHRIHMARMAVYATHSTNGVAALHTEILKHDALKEWYAVYPERFSNKTNGITQRRWLGLCNPGLASFITDRIGDKWLTELGELKRLEAYANDDNSLRQFAEIKRHNKERLAAHIRLHEHGFELNTESIFDVQVKRLHEYKRQLLNALSILDIYFSLKDGSLNDFYPMTFLFGAKSAPGYKRAKGIIKFINEIAKLVNLDPDTKDKLQVLFVQNYNVSYAEKLIPAADISEQISTAGTEASGTGNMKFMLSGAVTLGTYDGANIEIVEQAGVENNYIFGAKVEEIRKIEDSYNPKKLYFENDRIKRVLDCLINGMFNDGHTGAFRDIFDSIIEGTSWHRPDQYYLLLDFESYVDTKLRANRVYRDRLGFTRQCLINTANAGTFSSDRTIKQYANEIWKI